MAKQNAIRSSKKVATIAAKAIKSKSTSKLTKTLGGSALENRKEKPKKR